MAVAGPAGTTGPHALREAQAASPGTAGASLVLVAGSRVLPLVQRLEGVGA